MNSNRLCKAINTAHIIFWKSLTYHTALSFLVWQWALRKVGIIFWRTATRWWSCTCGVCVFGTTCCHPSSSAAGAQVCGHVSRQVCSFRGLWSLNGKHVNYRADYRWCVLTFCTDTHTYQTMCISENVSMHTHAHFSALESGDLFTHFCHAKLFKALPNKMTLAPQSSKTTFKAVSSFRLHN